ncbi:hypothetical protein OEG84_25210 [Hoeflea sp. G2-23]|uniref:Uncharacterized protein n=1 Tax=Hoeflea algicola TaxID=2983763 RepID=A0ABT3ZGT0_9HYPH|nr:hypothetical protein [Hoeflea algicola]MCY0150908.1 hypothetical protein [Hoeflea algicola]
MKPNTLRNKALKAAAANPDYSVELARQRWQAVFADHPDASDEQKTAARLAMITIIAAKGSLEDAEKAARKVLR